MMDDGCGCGIGITGIVVLLYCTGITVICGGLWQGERECLIPRVSSRVLCYLLHRMKIMGKLWK